jgi:hypothetical protein
VSEATDEGLSAHAHANEYGSIYIVSGRRGLMILPSLPRSLIDDKEVTCFVSFRVVLLFWQRSLWMISPPLLCWCKEPRTGMYPTISV